MSQPFVGEIRMVGFNFAPVGWAFCNGAILAISQNDVLFALIGTTYGGDGQQTFALPDLACRIPIHQGSGYVIGQQAGSETVTVTATNMPAHTHSITTNNKTASSTSPAGNILAGDGANPYTSAGADTNLGAATIGLAGGSQPHENMMPYQCINFVISLFGIFPSQN